MSDAESRVPWTPDEVEATVAEYFHMLALELSGQAYTKAQHRRALLPKLRNRSEAAIELKHQNISAILIELRAPWIVGYKPRRNYQLALYDTVAVRLAHDRRFDEIAAEAVERPAVVPKVDDYAELLVDAPIPREVEAPPASAYKRSSQGVRRDYLGLEARNRALGVAGEEFVVAYERYQLHRLGAKALVDKVEHVSQTRGDGLGFDVLSFDATGAERLIEVKTTAFGREAPFYLSRIELTLSKAEPTNFRLYRLFEFRLRPHMFELAGPVDARCRLDPISYLASFR